MHVLVVGEAQVGKSSLISTLVSRHFSKEVNSVMHDVEIPREESEQNILTTIMDSSSSPMGRAALEERMRNEADVIIVVYAADNPYTFERVASYWLPLIRSTCGGSLPVVLVMNKIDTQHTHAAAGVGAGSPDHARDLRALMRAFEFVESYRVCSAKVVRNIEDVFYEAQKAVVYPMAPLLDGATSRLTPAFDAALMRVFRCCDRDRDGVLSNDEMARFQTRCFEGNQLEAEHAERLKLGLRSEVVGGIGPVSEDVGFGRSGEVKGEGRGNCTGVSFVGFRHIFKLWLERQRQEPCWMVLRRFDYSDDLRIVIPPAKLLVPAHRGDRSVELGDGAARFLCELFQQFATSGNAETGWEYSCGREVPTEGEALQALLLTREGRRDLFSICPLGEAMALGPWNEDHVPVSSVPGAPAGAVSKQGWLALWSLLTLLEPAVTLQFLYLLGFDKEPNATLHFTRARSKLGTKKGRLERHVKRCFLFGAPACGKSALLHSLLRRPFKESENGASSAAVYEPTLNGISVANKVAVMHGSNSEPAGSSGTDAGSETVPAARKESSKDASSRNSSTASSILVLTEVPAHSARSICADAKDRQAMCDSCDVICMAFDPESPASLAFVQQLQTTLPESIPCVYVATKADLMESSGAKSEWVAVLAEACAHCESLQLAPPLVVSSADGTGLLVSRSDHAGGMTPAAQLAADASAAALAAAAAATDGPARGRYAEGKAQSSACLFESLLHAAEHP